MTTPNTSYYGNPVMRPFPGLMASKPARPQFQAVSPAQANALEPAYDPKKDDASIWRDTSLRYGGYADEVGEFLTPYLGKVGQFAGYGLSTGYVMADMLTTLPRQYKNASPEFSTAKKSWQTAKEALDLGIFHGVATLLIPPMLIGSVVEATGHLLESPKPEAQFGSSAAKGVAVVQEGGGLRGLIDKGLGKLTNPIAPKTQKMAHDSVEYLAKNVISEGFLDKADQTVRGGKGALTAIADGCAKAANFCNKLGPLKSIVDEPLVKTLRENADSIRHFQSFKGKGLPQKGALEAGKRKLASLLFVKPIPVAIGLGMVPLIAHPFDELMLKVQDWTIRPLIGKNKIIKDENGHYKSVRNPAFWGRNESPQANRSSASQGTNSGKPHAGQHIGPTQSGSSLRTNPFYSSSPVNPFIAQQLIAQQPATHQWLPVHRGASVST